jgi:hypothetical protein
MDSDSEGSSGAPPWSPDSSESGDSGNRNATTPPCSASYEPNRCQQTNLNAEFEQLAAYLVDRKAPKALCKALQRIQDAFEENASKQTTTDAIYTLQEAVKKLTVQIEAKPTGTHASGPLGTSYAAAAQRGAAGAAQSRTQSYAEPTKPVPARHKREIIATRGVETAEQAQRTGKELVEQLNSAGADIGGQVVAARRLPSGDIVLTTDEEQTRTKWITDQKWLKVFGTDARVKRREFIVLAHGIRVSQAQEPQQAIQDIYKQNPKLQGTVEILRVAWTRKLLRTGRKMGPLHISVAEPEQANVLIRSGLIWDYELHDCEPFIGECQVTQCFRCYQYGHLARMCRNTPRCGFCAGPNHATNDCIVKEDSSKHQCAPCGSPTAQHTAWDHNCPVRTRHFELAKLAYSTRATLFQERAAATATVAPAPPAAPATAAASAAAAATTLATPRDARAATEPAPEPRTTTYQRPWQTVGSKRMFSPRSSQGSSEPQAKRPKGRPIGSTKASRNTKDIRSFASTQ